jgi:hypothetical protein
MSFFFRTSVIAIDVQSCPASGDGHEGGGDMRGMVMVGVTQVDVVLKNDGTRDVGMQAAPCMWTRFFFETPQVRAASPTHHVISAMALVSCVACEHEGQVCRYAWPVGTSVKQRGQLHD